MEQKGLQVDQGGSRFTPREAHIYHRSTTQASGVNAGYDSIPMGIPRLGMIKITAF